MPAGVMPPSGAAAGTGPQKTAGIVKTNDPANPAAGELVTIDVSTKTDKI